MKAEERELAGLVYAPGDPALVNIKRKAHNLSTEYNATFEDETENRQRILAELLGGMGVDCRMQGPIYIHYGTHTSVGDRFFANFNFTVQDDTTVEIGDDCNFGPNVTIVTPLHPMIGEERYWILDENGKKAHVCYAKPVKIGNHCWFGANVVVCPGVTIGDGCVIGAGSVVTRDIPARSFAAGNPCRVIREITDADSLRHRPEILADYQIPVYHAADSYIDET